MASDHTRTGGSWSHPAPHHARAPAARGVSNAGLIAHDPPAAAGAAQRPVCGARGA